MRTFAQIYKPTLQTKDVNSVRPGGVTSGQSHEIRPILHLQRTVGKRAALRLPPTNAEEREAGSTGTASPPFAHTFSRIPIHPPAAGLMQTKLVINKPGDEYEQEADRVAEQVMGMSEPQRACTCSNREDHLQARRSEGNATQSAVAPPAVHEVLTAPGQPLDSGIRGFMEPRFGHDFSLVRVHNDGKAAESARAINARAYTFGRSVVFGPGEYAPHSFEGRRLLAHELAHVVQQQAVSVLPTCNLQIAFAGDVFEREATALAEEIVPSGAKTIAPLSSSQARISRQVAAHEKRAATETEEDTATEERIDRVDGFLADRVRLFTVGVWGDRYVAILDRTRNTWCERYTPQALTAAGVAAVVHYITDSPPPVAQIDALLDELLSEQRYGIEAPAMLGPAAVDPMYISRIDRGAVGTLIARMGLELSDRGRELEAATGFGAFLAERLVEVAQNFGSVRRHLDANATLREAELTPEHVFTMLTQFETRQNAAERAKAHATTRVLGDARVRDWTALTPEQWAGALADIAAQVVEGAGRSALERQERQRRHQLNEHLRPHRLQIAAADSARYILETYDPNSSVTVNFLGPVAIEGGQVITNARRQELFILRAGAQVIYQNLSDHRFYVQSAQGVQQELVYGVFALVAEKTKHIIPMTQFMLDVTAAIFPPFRLPYLAVNVLNASSNFAANKDELLRLAEKVQISRHAIEELLPGLLGKAVRATVSGGLGELFNPRHTSAAPQQILLLALRIASAGVRGSAAGRQAGEAAKTAWAEIRRELRTLGGIMAQVQALVMRQVSEPGSWDEHPAERLSRELSRFVGHEGERYALLLMSMDDEQIRRLVHETEELQANGTALVNLIASSLAW